MGGRLLECRRAGEGRQPGTEVRPPPQSQRSSALEEGPLDGDQSVKAAGSQRHCGGAEMMSCRLCRVVEGGRGGCRSQRPAEKELGEQSGPWGVFAAQACGYRGSCPRMRGLTAGRGVRAVRPGAAAGRPTCAWGCKQGASVAAGRQLAALGQVAPVDPAPLWRPHAACPRQASYPQRSARGGEAPGILGPHHWPAL